MSVHIQTLSNKNLNLLLRIYSGVPDSAPVYHHRLDFDGVCLATIKPQAKEAWIFAYHGEINKKDYIDLFEAIYEETGVKEVVYERARGYIVHLVRHGARKWKKVPTESKNLSILAANFSGMPEE